MSVPSGYGSLDQEPQYAAEEEGSAGKKSEISEERNEIVFHNISYEVSVRCGTRRKVILQPCSGILRPGLNAIMGPTGSGKTTLLDIMADRKGERGVSGTVLINGRRRPKNFKCISGYVVQDDLIMGALSVRENLQFSANLRLPSGMTNKQRKARVEKVIEELSLQSCANTKIGTELIRGVSGGERKRASIGMELIIEPPALFLDEATTGLDAHTAVSVIKLLKRLTHSGRVIVLSIHQPRYSIFRQFDSLTLLSRGEMVYHGPALQTLPYFEKLGFPCDERENPADYFLDVLTLCEKKETAEKVEFTADADTETLLVSTNGEEEKHFMPEMKTVDMAVSYQQGEMCRETSKQVDQTLVALSGEGRMKRVSYISNIFRQLYYVTSRAMVGLLRDPLSFYFQIVLMSVFGLLVGLVYFQLGSKKLTRTDLQNVISDRIGVFFFMVMNQAFSNMSAVDLFIKRKALFIHENSSGYYRVSVFFFALIFTDLIAKRLLPVILYSTIAYFMVGLDLAADKFFIFLLTMFNISATAACITYAYSSIVSVTTVATLLSALTFVLSALFGGFFIALQSLPVWLRWLKYLSCFRYSLEALSINEIAGKEYHIHNDNSTACLPGSCINGTQSLRDIGFETTTLWLWGDQIALVGLSLVFLTLCFISLQLIKKHK